ncbi:MAG: hypothetical protein QMB24_19315 [Spirosomataceae bacterium]
MKKHILLLLIVIATACHAQRDKHTFSETISKEYSVNFNTTLALYNLNGDVDIEGYDGNVVRVEIKKTISAQTEDLLNEGKRDFRLSFNKNSDSLIVYISEPWDTHPNRNYEKEDWQNRKPVEYQVELNYKVQVPNSLNVRASTVNGGEVVVRNVAGQLHVNNVPGGITIEDAHATTRAHTVNGNVMVNYLKNPLKASSYHTINGNINVTYQPNLAADLTFKSINGEYFTEFKNYKLLPNEVEESKSGNGTKYKVSSRSPIRIGNGGTKLKFETLNGDIYIKRG